MFILKNKLSTVLAKKIKNIPKVNELEQNVIILN